MVMGVWSRSGSDKAKSSQTIRILLRSMQYLAEDLSTDETKFLKIVVPVVRSLFKPITTASVNEQVQQFFDSMGWKNSQIQVVSKDKSQIVLGSNRYLDQNEEATNGLTLLVKTLTKAVGYHIMNSEVDPLVVVDFTNTITYTIELKVQGGTDISSPVHTPKATTTIAKPVKTSKVTPPPSHDGLSVDIGTKIEIDQLFAPVINSKLPLSRCFLHLQDVMEEFSISWYSMNPIEGKESLSQREIIVTLVQFLVEKSIEASRDVKMVGNQVGRFFAQAMVESFKNDFGSIISDEILESNTQTIIRDIKAMSLCTLSPGDKCVPANRSYCDFAMGIYEGVLSTTLDAQFEFTSYFSATRRDRYCLMEFNKK